MRYLITIVLLLLVGSQSHSQCASPTTMLFEDFEGAAPVIISIPGTTYGSVWSLKWAVPQSGVYTWVVGTKNLFNDEIHVFNGHVTILK